MRKEKVVLDGDRTRNLPLRRRTPYPLGHEDAYIILRSFIIHFPFSKEFWKLTREKNVKPKYHNLSALNRFLISFRLVLSTLTKSDISNTRKIHKNNIATTASKLCKNVCFSLLFTVKIEYHKITWFILNMWKRNCTSYLMFLRKDTHVGS